jgi:16S rRNA (cytosine967-C5)-methyltransferase
LAGAFGSALDACAGLGGKTLALAALRPEAHIVAVDRDAERLAALRAEAGRLGLPNRPRTVAAELEAVGTDEIGGPFPLVVLDAPCSGLGVARRRPDLKWARGPEDVAALARLQKDLMGAAARHVEPGGRLIYAVCTITEAEGPSVMDWFYGARPDFRPWTADEIEPSLRPLAGGPGALRLWPNKHGTVGFFYGLAVRGS